MCVEGSIIAWRFLVHPVIESAFGLGPDASSIVRRCAILVVVVAAYAAFVRFYERRPPLELRPRWGWTLLAAAAGAASIGVTIVALYATGHYELVAFRGFAGTPDVLAQIAIAAVIEELTFRAVLFRILEETLGTTGALAGSAVVFAVAHLANNGLQEFTLVTITLAGLMWAGLFIVWRNVWVAAAHHCCWNATIFLIGVPLSGEDWQAQAPLVTDRHGSALWTGGTFGPEDSIVNIVVMIVIVGALLGIGRRRGRFVPGGAAR